MIVIIAFSNKWPRSVVGLRGVFNFGDVDFYGTGGPQSYIICRSIRIERNSFSKFVFLKQVAIVHNRHENY